MIADNLLSYHREQSGRLAPCLDSPPALVQAPSRLTTFRWCPMWMRIFSSDISAWYSLDVAPSTAQRHGVQWRVFFGCSQCNARNNKCLTFKHLDCNSCASRCFLDTEGSCFYHLTKCSASQWVTFIQYKILLKLLPGEKTSSSPTSWPLENLKPLIPLCEMR